MSFKSLTKALSHTKVIKLLDVSGIDSEGLGTEHQPEKILAVNIILRALVDYFDVYAPQSNNHVDGHTHTEIDKRRRRNETLVWFTSSDDTLGSFSFWCNFIDGGGLENEIRKFVWENRNRDLSKRFHNRRGINFGRPAATENSKASL